MPEVIDVFAGANDEQIELMKEMCIQVDNDDKVIGGVSKKDGHLVTNINKGVLHRAFSVFLFNTKGELLLQQRSEEKITFPNMFTNTCCSHPLLFPEEMEEEGALGVKRAAIRKLDQELGIKPSSFTTDDFHFLTRIHYKACSDDVWGEHEIDHILFCQKDIEMDVNYNECKSVKYVNKEELKQIVLDAENGKGVITPWFKLIVNTFIWKWWDELDHITDLGDKLIHRL